MDTLTQIETKITAGQRLDASDGAVLFAHPDIVELGHIADQYREKFHGAYTFYNKNLHLNVTNVCEGGCEFCSFARSSECEDGAYTMDFDSAMQWIAQRYYPELTEIHIVNGLHPDLSLSFYETLIAEIRSSYPTLAVKALGAVEIAHLAKKSGLSTMGVLETLKAAGVSALPGGGAEVFAERVRKQLCSKKINASEWLRIHGEAHSLGMISNCTMLFGTVETVEERVEHLLALREQQDLSGGFQAFIPLPYHPDWSRLGGRKPSTADMLRTISVSRLLLDNIMHIKAYWVALGLDAAQLAQRFGADDFDGTVTEEKIYHMSASASPEGLTESRLKELIEEVGRIPLERGTSYQLVETAGDAAAAR